MPEPRPEAEDATPRALRHGRARAFPNALELTRGVARGDAAALAALYEGWFDRLYAGARRVTRRDESFCLDVVQDTMLRAIRSLRPLDTDAALGRWLERVLYTTALDHLRRETRRRRHERAAAAARGETSRARGPDEVEELEEAAAWLREAIASLPAVERKLLAARYLRGETLAAAGSRFGMSGNAASGRIQRLLARLRTAARGLFPEVL